jgi:hypothetical protein
MESIVEWKVFIGHFSQSQQRNHLSIDNHKAQSDSTLASPASSEGKVAAALFEHMPNFFNLSPLGHQLVSKKLLALKRAIELVTSLSFQ